MTRSSSQLPPYLHDAVGRRDLRDLVAHALQPPRLAGLIDGLHDVCVQCLAGGQQQRGSVSATCAVSYGGWQHMRHSSSAKLHHSNIKCTVYSAGSTALCIDATSVRAPKHVALPPSRLPPAP